VDGRQKILIWTESREEGIKKEAEQEERTERGRRP
jgi:hypothetical protein